MVRSLNNKYKIGDLLRIRDDTLKGDFDYGIVMDCWREQQYDDLSYYYEVKWANDGLLKHENYWIYENCELIKP